MTINNVKFCSEPEALRIQPDSSMALISITNPGDLAPVQAGWGAMHRISFADASYDEREIRFFEKMWYQSSQGFFTKQHALPIIDFLDNLDESISQLIIHCGAGQSRSAAVALYAANRYGLKLMGDAKQYNVTVLNLLQNPTLYDAILPEEKVNKNSFTRKLIALLFG
jgi:predicted protein tyrosine phosphatase